MQHDQHDRQHIKTGPIDPNLHEQLVAARAARSIVVTDDMSRSEIPDEYLAIDPERWDGMG
jgi:hypothetical protein